MKKIFLFASAMMAALTMNAQTVVAVDGNASEWATVPMVTEPGVAGNVLKYLVPQTGFDLGSGNAFAVMLQTDATIEAANTITIYVDADKSNATGQQCPWFVQSMYRDYEMGVDGNGGGITGAQRATSGKVTEITMPTSAFSSPAFVGNFWGYFSYNWGAFYVPNSPTEDSWKWDQSKYQPTNVCPFTFALLDGEHRFADTYARHQCVAAGDTLDWNVSGGSQDTALWASWTVNVEPGKYDITINGAFSDNTGLEFYLVDIATNQVVDTIANNYPWGTWQPADGFAYGTWDLSGISAGNYMLKVKSFVAWSHAKLAAVHFAKQGGTGMMSVDAPAAAEVKKCMKNGQMIIMRGKEMYSALGQQIR